MLVLAWKVFLVVTISGQFSETVDDDLLLNGSATVYTARTAPRPTVAPFSSRESLIIFALIKR